jgi:hypothetical protein
VTYRRCVYRSEEWTLLVESGWLTLHVNRDGMALMAKNGDER